MPARTYATSGAVDASTVSTTPGSPTTLLTAPRQVRCVVIDNDSNQTLTVTFGDGTTDDFTIRPGRSFVIDSEILGRRIEQVVKGRMASAATGFIVVNVFM